MRQSAARAPATLPSACLSCSLVRSLAGWPHSARRHNLSWPVCSASPIVVILLCHNPSVCMSLLLQVALKRFSDVDPEVCIQVLSATLLCMPWNSAGHLSVPCLQPSLLEMIPSRSSALPCERPACCTWHEGIPTWCSSWMRSSLALAASTCFSSTFQIL